MRQSSLFWSTSHWACKRDMSRRKFTGSRHISSDCLGVRLWAMQLTIATPKDRVEAVCDIPFLITWVVFGQERVELKLRFDLAYVVQTCRDALGVCGQVRIDKEEAVVRQLQADSTVT